MILIPVKPFIKRLILRSTVFRFLWMIQPETKVQNGKRRKH